MAQRGLTELLNAHHNKLNEHTHSLKQIEAQLAAMQATVDRLDQQLASEQATTSDDDTSGLRAGLREWINNIKELM